MGHKKAIRYIEQKTDGNTDLNHRGPAVIGEVTYSKTGKVMYDKGKTFEPIRVYSANYECVEDGNEYWISGVKKNREDRHWIGAGPVQIDEDVREEYLRLVGE
jgi:hypothetical protein